MKAVMASVLAVSMLTAAGCTRHAVQEQPTTLVHVRIDSNINGIPIKAGNRLLGTTPMDTTIAVPIGNAAVTVEYDEIVYKSDGSRYLKIAADQKELFATYTLRDVRPLLSDEFKRFDTDTRLEIVDIINMYEKVYSVPKDMIDAAQVDAKGALNSFLVKHQADGSSEWVGQLKLLDNNVSVDFSLSNLRNLSASLGLTPIPFDGLGRIAMLKRASGQVN